MKNRTKAITFAQPTNGMGQRYSWLGNMMAAQKSQTDAAICALGHAAKWGFTLSAPTIDWWWAGTLPYVLLRESYHWNGLRRQNFYCVSEQQIRAIIENVYTCLCLISIDYALRIWTYSQIPAPLILSWSLQCFKSVEVWSWRRLIHAVSVVFELSPFFGDVVPFFVVLVAYEISNFRIISFVVTFRLSTLSLV